MKSEHSPEAPLTEAALRRRVAELSRVQRIGRVGGANVAGSALPISPVVAAGVLSGAAPFGFLVG